MQFLLFYLQTLKTPEVIILSLFLVVFQGLLPKMKSNLEEFFTSNALNGKASHMSRFLM